LDDLLLLEDFHGVVLVGVLQSNEIHLSLRPNTKQFDDLKVIRSNNARIIVSCNAIATW
jgi:hypothetical protein